MGYLKYTQYAYLVIAVLFIYDAIMRINAGENTPWLSFVIAGVGVFMFFFRRKFSRKFDNHNKKQ
jgi:positive regulator of sigma E activity